MKVANILLYLTIIMLLCTLPGFPSRADLLSYNTENEPLVSHTNIQAQNITRTFHEMEIECLLVADHSGSFDVTVEKPIHSPYAAGVVTVTLHTRHNTTTQRDFSPIPTFGYQLTAKIANESLGTTTLLPPVTITLYEEIIQLSKYLESIPEETNLTLKISAIFHAMKINERVTLEVLPTSLLTIEASTPETTTQSEGQSSEGTPEESSREFPDEDTGDESKVQNESQLMTVGPVVFRPLEAWKELSSQAFILKAFLLFTLLGITLNFLNRRKKLTEKIGDAFTQVLIEEIEAEEEDFEMDHDLVEIM